MINKLFGLLIGLYPLCGFCQDNTTFCEQVSILQSLVESKHYSPKTLNDSVSKQIFNLFLDQLDSDKQLFLQSDIDGLKADIFKFDDYVVGSNCSFIDNYTKVLNLRIQFIKSQLESLKTATLDYSGKHTLQFIPEKEYSYYKDEDALDIVLQKKVSFKVISKLMDMHKDVETIASDFKILEHEVKLEIIENELCLLDEIINKDGGLERFVKESFLNALVKVNDPNSTFFNNTEKVTYLNRLSKNQLSFGVVTRKNKKGEIVIAHIIPGSVAFKNGKLEKNDVLRLLSTSHSSLDILCVSNDEIALFLNNEDNMTVNFSVKKKNGTLQEVTLTKSKIKVDANAVRGYLINTTKALGYIKIPSFYSNIESPNGRGLTKDMAKELYKLQKANIEGLILDLRFNGGGSMQEAIELSGMFIDRGPVSIIKSNTGKTLTMRDNKRGSFYKKPIVILVNEYSASASEFFSAAMQDYNRAIIVGSKTYGKSSAQTILALGEFKNLGFVKLTVDVFYRVTGKSHQSKGVIPDIALSSLYDGFKSSECHKPHALKNDSIAVTLKHKPLQELNINEVIEKSKARTKADKGFQDIEVANKTLCDLLFKKGERHPLTLQSIVDNKKNRQLKMDAIFKEDDKEKPALLEITNTKSTQELLEYSADDKTQNEKTIKDLSYDIYIKEAQHILIDYINSNQ